jgi:HD-GYP domain-containing protein (c-di-GMP phosphodiesterase class II)
MRHLQFLRKGPGSVAGPPPTDIAEAITRALALVIEKRDPTTAAHCAMVGELAAQTAVTLGISTDEHHIIVMAGRLHDLGKIAIPDRVLHNSNDLDARELGIIRSHVEHGEAILDQLSAISAEIAAVAVLVGAHHERWDGHGYPRGLAGADIPRGGRILAVADAYSALVMKRSYQGALSHAEAMDTIASGSGIHFDPQVVEAFAALGWADWLAERG